jgi:hypothetical protein
MHADKRFNYLAVLPSRSVRNAPVALSACVAALNPTTLVTNPCGIPIQTFSLAMLSAISRIRDASAV